MKYKLLGKSGLRVSEVSLGTMTFGEDWGWGASIEESRKLFEMYVEAGAISLIPLTSTLKEAARKSLES